jgi:hypothetical protein
MWFGTWLLPFLSATGSQPDRQASSPPQSDELPVRRCFLCRIRTKIKSFHGTPMSKQQEFDAPDVQVSLFSLRNLSYSPQICVVSAVGSACGLRKEEPDFEKVS